MVRGPAASHQLGGANGDAVSDGDAVALAGSGGLERADSASGTPAAGEVGGDGGRGSGSGSGSGWGPSASAGRAPGITSHEPHAI